MRKQKLLLYACNAQRKLEQVNIGDSDHDDVDISHTLWI